MGPLSARQVKRHELQLKKHLVRNYLAHSIEGGLFGGAMAFVAGNVLPKMIQTLGGQPWLITLMPIAMPIGWMLPPLLIAHRIEKIHWVHPLLLFTGLMQRLPYLLAGLALILGSLGHWSLLAAAALAPFLSGLAGGLSQSAWQELVAKTLPENRRSGVMAIRNLISTGIGIAAGIIVRWLLAAFEGRITVGYGILHLVGFGLLMLSYAVFAMIRETNLPPRPHRDTPTLWSNLMSLPLLVANRPQYRLFLLDRLLIGGGVIMAPWVSIHACAVLGKADSFLGDLLLAGVIGGFAGNILAGPMGDRFGGKAAMMVARLLSVAVAAWMPFARTEWGFFALFAMMGLAGTFGMVGRQTLTLEIVPAVKRATYLSMISAVGLITSLIGSQISRVTWQVTGGSFHWAAWLTLAFTAASVVPLVLIKEPRHRAPNPDDVSGLALTRRPGSSR